MVSSTRPPTRERKACVRYLCILERDHECGRKAGKKYGIVVVHSGLHLRPFRIVKSSVRDSERLSQT